MLELHLNLQPWEVDDLYLKCFCLFEEFNIKMLTWGWTCFSYWFPDFQLWRQSSKFASDGKKLPQNPTLFQQGGRYSPFCKLTPWGDCGLAISLPPPCTSLLGETHKAGNWSCKDGHGFMTLRQVQLNKAYSHLGWEPLPYVEIYD